MKSCIEKLKPGDRITYRIRAGWEDTFIFEYYIIPSAPGYIYLNGACFSIDGIVKILKVKPYDQVLHS